MSLLVVYNTCGLTGRENSDHYINNINTILNQDFNDYKLVFSGCLIKQETFEKVYATFGKKISYYLTNEKLAVNQSFNHAVLKGIEEYGEFDGYMYVASDVRFSDDRSALSKINARIVESQNGIVYPEIDHDNGYFWWFDYPEDKNIWEVFGRDTDFTVPVGKTANLHCAAFSKKIVQTYGRPLPDIFVSYCSESSFSFLAAAVQQKFIIANDVLCHHGMNQGPSHQLDGQTQVFGAGWDIVYPGAKSVRELISSQEAIESGFGHEEWAANPRHNAPADKPYLVHDATRFDENGYSISESLEQFIKHNLFLSPSTLDYNTIEHQFIREAK